MGKPKDKDYWKKWRATHPEYVARERTLSRIRKRNRTTAQRRAERERARLRALSSVETTERRREQSRRSTQAWTERNPDAAKESFRTWQQANQERRTAYNRELNRRKQAEKIYAEAKEIVLSTGLKADTRVVYQNTIYEDAVQLAATMLWTKNHSRTVKVQMVTEAVREFIRWENSYDYHSAPLLDEVLETN